MTALPASALGPPSACRALQSRRTSPWWYRTGWWRRTSSRGRKRWGASCGHHLRFPNSDNFTKHLGINLNTLFFIPFFLNPLKSSFITVTWLFNPDIEAPPVRMVTKALSHVDLVEHVFQCVVHGGRTIESGGDDRDFHISLFSAIL